MLGTGGGGAGDLTGAVIDRLLAALTQHVSQHHHKVDCVLVCADSATYAHAQSVRHQHVQSQNQNRYPLFSSTMLPWQEKAKDLASLAAIGKLSLFLGAGVSIGSGLPGWYDLLEQVERQFVDQPGMGEKFDWDPLQIANELDKVASLNSDKAGKKLSLKERVCRIIENGFALPSLLLTLLVSLETPSIVTQNYDELIERAVACHNIAEQHRRSRSRSGGGGLPRQRRLSVFPHDPVKNAKRWLLHMHGCTRHPSRIVLTQEDYDERREVLGGLVQANLMTSHFLFCGFSLTDPNYLRIVKEVREAIHPTSDGILV